MVYSRKKQAGGLRTYFFDHWIFLFIYFTPGNSRQIKAPPLEIVQICVTSLGNSKTKNQDPWKFHIIFSWSPLDIPQAISLIPLKIQYPQHPLFVFFSEIAQCKEGVYFFFHLILVGISSILILSVKNRGWDFFCLTDKTR